MKAIIFKSVLVTMMMFFASIGVSLAQEKDFYHNVIEDEGTKTISVYVMDNFNSLRRYKESLVELDYMNRPVKKTVQMWSRSRSKWEPCRTFVYKYDNEYCTITMKWHWSYAYNQTHMQNQKYRFPLVSAGMEVPYEQLALFDVDYMPF